MRHIHILLILALFSFSINAQNKELILERSVKPHKEIDAIYKQFSEAYQTLDVEKVTNLYTKDAAYLPPNNDILTGREAILQNFKGFFDWVKKEGQTMTISFNIFQRKVAKDIAYDVGIYTIQNFKDGKKVGEGKGKFVVVALKVGKDWKFQVDGYNNIKSENNN